MTQLRADRSPQDSPDRTRPAPGESYRETVVRLSAAQKTAKGAPAYSRFVNRRLGRFIAAGAFHAGLTPNVVTAVSAVFSFAAIALIALLRPSWPQAVLVLAGLVLGYAFDAADGQLARLRGGGSTSGEWLDHMVDATKISSLHLAVLIAGYRFTDLDRAWLLVPIGFTIVAAVMFFGMILNDSLRREKAATRGVPLSRPPANSLRSLLVIPTDYGLLCVAFLLLGAPRLFEVVYGLIFLANLGFMLLAAVKWFHDMDALDVHTVDGATASATGAAG